jgi:hypothetical protein
LNVRIDLGSVLEDIPPTPPDEAVQTRKAQNVEVRYRLVRANGTSFCDYGANCALHTGAAADAQGIIEFSTQGTATSPHLPITPDSRGNAVAIEVRLRHSSATPNPGGCGPGNDFNNLCRWFYAGEGTPSASVPPTDAQILAAPIQRSFMGHLERTGPIKWLRLTMDRDCDLVTLTDRVIGHDYMTGEDAASQPLGEQRCYVVELGMAGGLARDQDEPPIAFNLGDNSSQRAYLDCDPGSPNLKDEIVAGCRQPSYSVNKFDTTPYCPDAGGFFTTPKAAPFQSWPPFRCVLTQTGNSGQVIQGFNERLFGRSNNPRCDTTNPISQFVRGRNYWHRLNNRYDAETFAWDGTGTGGGDPNGTAKGNTIRSDDPRLVTLFFTTYDSFTSTGNETYPIVGFGNFYVTGYGETINGRWQGGAPEDPCTDGNGLAVGAGNSPPPDLDMSRNTRWVWGHFVKDVVPSPFSTGGSGVLCNPEASFQPCVAVLVE